ncbi:MAG: alpha/beta hydrolase fold domain-containing protein [Planctomycetota bacterium]|nr:alpha/beta hydrolase fold domain-containing protein [Planctomycetota bacterium]
MARLPLSLLLVLLLALPALAEDAQEIRRDLTYATVGSKELKLDLYRPENATGKEPLVVWIHGGGWRRGNKRNCQLRWMTEHGYAVASIQYRLSGEAIWPAQIHDCKGAIRWLRANASRLGFDATRVGVGGSSAGGHLAALLGTSGGVAALEGTVGGNADQSSRVQAVYDQFGPADFSTMGRGGGAVGQLLGGAPAEKPEAARLASPTSHVTQDDPPFLIAHGARDRLVPLDQSRRLTALLEKAGVPVTLRVYEEAGHGGPAFGRQSHRAIVRAFFDQHLKGATSTSTPTVTAPSRTIATWSAKGRHATARLEHTVLRDEKRQKDLQVRVTYPTSEGRFPVLVWSHGAGGSKEAYGPLVDHWATHGFVVIQATHADSRKLARQRGGLERMFAGFADRPKDVTLVLDSLTTLAKRMKDWRGTFDTQAIGVGGHSFGAHTSQLVGGVTTGGVTSGARASHRDARAKAVLLVSPQGRGGELDQASFTTLTVPMLTITGTRDRGRGGQPFTWRLEPFSYAPPGDKYAALIDGARHSFGGITGHPPNRRTGPANVEHVNAVKALSLLFWQAYLRGDDDARALLASDRIAVESARSVRVTSR